MKRIKGDGMMSMISKIKDNEKLTNIIVMKLLAEKELHQQYIKRYQKELAFLPEGMLTRKIINGKPYYYQTIKNEKGILL
jgi:hypothetical protein